MLKVWNVFLLMYLTFITDHLPGTFLTRSRPDRQRALLRPQRHRHLHFAWYLVFLCVVCLGLIFYRLPLLRAENRIDSMLSGASSPSYCTNWVTFGDDGVRADRHHRFPLFSEWIHWRDRDRGARLLQQVDGPLGLVLMLLTGIGPLISLAARHHGRRSEGVHSAIRPIPPARSWSSGYLLAFGARLGFQAYVSSDAIYDTMTGRVLHATIYGVSPGASVLLCTFVLATIVQEFWRGTRIVRMKNAGEGVFIALFELVTRAKRRYGGYIVHASLVLDVPGLHRGGLRRGGSQRSARASASPWAATSCATTAPAHGGRSRTSA